MASDPDDMWKPGFDGDVIAPSAPSFAPQPDRPAAAPPAPAAPAASTPTSTASPVTVAAPEIEFTLPDDDAPGASVPSRRRRSSALVVGLLAALAIAAAVIVVPRLAGDGDRSEFGEVDGADPRRLPSSADVIWSTTIDGLDIDSDRPGDLDINDLIVDGRDIAIAKFEDPAPQRAVLVGVDAVTGDIRWRTALPYDASSARFLGVIDDTLIIEQLDTTDRRLFGLSTADGSTTWELDTNDNGVHVVLNDTKVVTRISFTGAERLTFIDPVDGTEVGRLVGRLTSTDFAGTWFVKNDRRVLSLDLSNGYAEPVEVAAAGAVWNEPTAVIDGRIIVVEDRSTLAEIVPDESERTPLVAVGGNLPNIVSLVQTGDGALAIIGEGELLGARLVDDDVQVQWSERGTVQAATVTNRGMLFALGDADGTGAARVVEASRGETIGAIAASSSRDERPELVGDGFVLIDDADLGSELVGYDLDGEERWRLPNSAPFRIGDRVIVTLVRSGDGYALTGYGDAE